LSELTGAVNPDKAPTSAPCPILPKAVAAGAIFEGAGRANPQGQPWVGPKAGSRSNKVSKSNNPRAGAQFIENLPPLVSSLKGRGRLIYRAWALNQGRAEGAAMSAIDTAIKQFEARQAQGSLKKVA